jgi:hypothetical protein
MEPPRLGPGSLDRWLTERFPHPHADSEILLRFSHPSDEPVKAALSMFGHALWQVLSDERTVVDVQGRIVGLTSHRESAGMLADWLNRNVDAYWFTYTDFTLAEMFTGGDADPDPDTGFARFSLIFQRMHGRGDRWIWQDAEQIAQWKAGDARSGAVDARNRSRLGAVANDVPARVDAYRSVYGHWPEGFSPG